MSKTYGAAAIAVMIAVSCSAAHGQVAPKGPEPATLKANAELAKTLPFADRQDFDDAMRGFIGTTPLVREHLFSAHTPDDIVESCAARVQPEAVRASLVDPLFRRVRTARVSTPMLVLGAADDGMVTNAEVRATAKAYNTDAEFFPDMGHNMMQEPGWAGVAQRIDAWLHTRELG